MDSVWGDDKSFSNVPQEFYDKLPVARIEVIDAARGVNKEGDVKDSIASWEEKLELAWPGQWQKEERCKMEAKGACIAGSSWRTEVCTTRSQEPNGTVGTKDQRKQGAQDLTGCSC